MRTVAPLLISALLCGPVHAQDDERLLRVVMQVLMDNAPASQFTVDVFRDNEKVGTLEPSEMDACRLMLEVNSYYTVRVRRSGMLDKLLSIATHLPDDVEQCKSYNCVVELVPIERSANVDPFYLDFPNAVIRWDPEKHRFDHSDHYLEAIRAKTPPAAERLVDN